MNFISNYFLLLFFMWLAGLATAQKIHTITGWKHGSFEDTVRTKVIYIAYQESGKLIAKSEMGVCYDTMAYDESDRLTYSNSICSESDTYCTYEYQKNKKTCDCRQTSGYRTLTIDSLDQEGKVIVRYYASYTDDTDSIPYIKNSSRFSYDAKKTEVYRKDLNDQNKVNYWVRETYFPSGKIKSIVSNFGPENEPGDDSTVFEYDEKNRITGVKKYEYYLPDGTFPAIYNEIKISYYDTKADVVTHHFNDTIIHANLPYEGYQFQIIPDHLPASIEFKSEEIENGVKTISDDISYYYSYDAKGRLSSIGGGGKKRNYDAHEKEVRISYYNDGTAVEGHYGKNYTGRSVAGYENHYKNGLLIQYISNTEHGFAYEITDYIYTFYK